MYKTPSLKEGVFVLIAPMPDQRKTKKHTNHKSGADQPAGEINKRSLLAAIMHDAGLISAPRCFRNYQFLLALLAGAGVLWLIHDTLPPFSTSVEFHWKLWLSLVIWQPIIEEVLFRGIVQGQLRKTAWGKRAWLHISAANIVTSIAFVTVHMINNPPLFSISVIIPSLLFGYFRDTCNSVYPAILLHSAYNAFVIEALFLHGNMMKLPL